MVDSVVSSVIKKLGNYVVGEVEFLRGVRGEVEWLKDELISVRRFINDALKKQRYNERIGQWVLDIMDIAYDCEDLLDEFIIKVHDEGIPDTLSVDQASTSEWQGLFTCLEKICCFPCRKAQEQMDLYRIGKQIERLKGRLKDAADRCERYELKKTEGESSARTRLKDLRRANSFQLEEIEVVGYDKDARTLLDQLLDKKKPQRSVISIFGTGGLGKTTLAGKLYHHPEIKKKFSLRALVSVSQDYNNKDLLERIILSFKRNRHMPETSQEDMTNEDSMGSYLRKSLTGQKYLVVIDDIWHKEAWDCLKRAFPDEKKGSRVIMTTRNEDIAREVDGSAFPYPLRFLTPDESWQLFCMKAFDNPKVDQGSKPQEWKMVQKCSGLPLAIVVLGGLLATKKPNQWSKIRNNIWKDMGSHNIEIKYLLDLSFDDLHSELKMCFLYLGLFPEDHEINIEKLIRFWVAEGLISEEGDNTMEELAEDNLNQLTKKSLIQIGPVSRGRFVTCRVHDLFRDLAIQKANELNFICTKHETENSAESSKSRRHAFCPGRNTSLLLQHCNPCSRSLLFFDQYSNEQPSLVEGLLPKLCGRFQKVRVVDFNNYHYKNSNRFPKEVRAVDRNSCHFKNSNSVPKEMEKLIHLRYLGLRNTSIRHLPSSIGKLLHLQTLDLPSDLQIPPEIGMLTELRHLIGCCDTELKIDNLTKLQTLKGVLDRVWAQVNTEKLVNLRELGITSINYIGKSTLNDRGCGKFTFDSIGNLKSLRILSIELRSSLFFDSLEPLRHCEHLQDIKLDGRMRSLPDNLHELVPKLECLSLGSLDLEEDPMPILEKLLGLTHLELDSYSYCGTKMRCSAKGFPRLEFLVSSKPMLYMLEVEEGAFPVLRKMKIQKIPNRTYSSALPINTKNLLSRVDVENYLY